MKRAWKLASLAGGLLVEEAKRKFAFQQTSLTRLNQVRALVVELSRLKGSAMKLGQLLALEAVDFLPPEAMAILDRLQNQADFLPFDQVNAVLRAELWSHVHRFESIDEIPIAAASLGQVHRARFEGNEVVLKVQYPEASKNLDSDLKLVGGIAERLLPLLVKTDFDAREWMATVREGFLDELNYSREAHWNEVFHRYYLGHPHISAPRVYRELCTSRVLVSEYASGRSISSFTGASELPASSRELISNLMMEVFTREFCEIGAVQSDPNLGNFLWNENKSQLVLLDFGATREFSPAFRRNYSRFIVAALDQDTPRMLRLAQEIGVFSELESDEARSIFVAMIERSVEPFRTAHFDFSSATYADDLRKLGFLLIGKLKHTPPPKDLFFVQRKLGGVFQILRRLGARIDLQPHLEPFRKCAELVT